MQLTKMSNRVSWYKDKDFQFALEPINEVVFLHMVIKRWSKSVLKNMQNILHEIEQEMSKLGYAHLLMYNPEQPASWGKLITKFAQYPVLFSLPNGHHVYGKDLRCL